LSSCLQPLFVYKELICGTGPRTGPVLLSWIALTRYNTRRSNESAHLSKIIEIRLQIGDLCYVSNPINDRRDPYTR